MMQFGCGYNQFGGSQRKTLQWPNFHPIWKLSWSIKAWALLQVIEMSKLLGKLSRFWVHIFVGYYNVESRNLHILALWPMKQQITQQFSNSLCISSFSTKRTGISCRLLNIWISLLLLVGLWQILH